MIIHCPHCKKENELEHRERGRHVSCPACHALFILDDATVRKEYSGVDFPPPEKIGPYPIERFLGKDSMGRIYKGIHPELGVPVSVKILSREYANNTVFRKRFEKACKICAGIEHPSLVRIYGYGTDSNGFLYLATEYVAGGTVEDMLLRSGPISSGKAAEIAIAVCSAMVAAQKQGIIHRDIRPENILITSNGKYKLANPGLFKYDQEKEDHGNAKRAASDHKEDTLELISLGTPEYMAPEQSIDANHCDIRADIYSLGVSMYQMLSGHLPFETDDRNELRRQHFETEPKIPSVYLPDIPIDIEYITMLCLRKKKTERYQTPEELITDLDAFMDGLPLPSANDNTWSANGKTRKFAVQAGRNILVRGNNTSFNRRKLFRIAEIGAIGLLAVATFWLLLERKLNQKANDIKNPQPAVTSLVMKRSDIWESIRKNALEALQRKRGFAEVIANLKSFENDEDEAKRKEAMSLLGRLYAASDQEVRKLMIQLDREARRYYEEHDYLSALAVFERDNPLFAESREERQFRIVKIRKALEEFSQQQKVNRDYLEKYVIPHLAAGNYTKALEWYKSKDNPGRDEAVLNILKECTLIPEKFAELQRASINQECKYFFRKEPFDSWRKQGKMKIMRVEPPYIYLHGHEENPFTIRDLANDEQEYVIRFLKNVSDQALALWSIGANCYSAPEIAEKYVGQLPFSLRDSYMMYLKERIMFRQIEAFRKDLRQLLADVGYSSNDLPAPEQLPNLNVFTTVEPEQFILRIDSMMKKYDSLPEEERSYLDALRNVRNEMDRRLNFFRQHHSPPYERDINTLTQETR